MRLTPSELMRMAKEHGDVSPDWAPSDLKGTFLALALEGEAGELGNLFKKKWRDEKSDTPERAAERERKIDGEIADVGNYFFMLCAQRGLDPMVICGDKMLEVEARPEYQELVRRRNYTLLRLNGGLA
jgi:hypothetical protein